jgi:hypothetical protein
MDKKIRGMINKELTIKGLSIECHHASWTDAGLFDPNLRDRDDVLTIRSFAQITLSYDECVRVPMRLVIGDEREFRRIEIDANALLFDWKEGTATRTGTSTIIKKTRRTCKNQGVGLKLEGMFIVVKANESERKTNYAVRLGRYVTQKVVRLCNTENLLRKNMGQPLRHWKTALYRTKCSPMRGQ